MFGIRVYPDLIMGHYETGDLEKSNFSFVLILTLYLPVVAQERKNSTDSAKGFTLVLEIGFHASYTESEAICSGGGGSGLGAQVKIIPWKFGKGGEAFVRVSAAAGFPNYSVTDVVAGIKPIAPVYVIYGLADLLVSDSGSGGHSRCSAGKASCTLDGLGLEYAGLFLELSMYAYLEEVTYDGFSPYTMNYSGSSRINNNTGFQAGFYF